MKVFISYRRQDSMYIAADLQRELIRRLGKGNVFLDIDNIPLGAKFVDHIRKCIGQATDVLVLIGPHWRPELLSDEGDFVRLELLVAEELNLRIVPVLHSNQPIPAPSQLPDEFTWLSGRNAYMIGAPPDDRAHIERLGDLLVGLAAADASGADASDAEASFDGAGLDLSSRDPDHGWQKMAQRSTRQRDLDFISASPHTLAARGALRRIFGGNQS